MWNRCLQHALKPAKKRSSTRRKRSRVRKLPMRGCGLVAPPGELTSTGEPRGDEGGGASMGAPWPPSSDRATAVVAYAPCPTGSSQRVKGGARGLWLARDCWLNP